MKILTLGLAVVALGSCGQSVTAPQTSTHETASAEQPINEIREMKTLHDFTTTTLNGEEFNFSELKGKRVLIVNTASECGYTPQYEQLQQLYETYGGESFTIVAFPSNDFGGQEPGTDQEIAAFCEKNYGLSFPIMSKTPVTGKHKHEVYVWLTDKKRNGRKDVEVQWNFNKFLVDENGEWVAYFPSGVDPLDDRIIRFAEGDKL